MAAVNREPLLPRPTTSKGRRQPDSPADIQGDFTAAGDSARWQSATVTGASFERPKTSHGRRANMEQSPRSFDDDFSTNVAFSERSPGTVDILRLDSDGEENKSNSEEFANNTRHRNSVPQGGALGSGAQKTVKSRVAGGVTSREGAGKQGNGSSVVRGQVGVGLSPAPPAGEKPMGLRRRSSVSSVSQEPLSLDSLPVAPKRPGSGRFHVLPNINDPPQGLPDPPAPPSHPLLAPGRRQFQLNPATTKDSAGNKILPTKKKLQENASTSAEKTLSPGGGMISSRGGDPRVAPRKVLNAGNAPSILPQSTRTQDPKPLARTPQNLVGGTSRTGRVLKTGAVASSRGPSIPHSSSSPIRRYKPLVTLRRLPREPPPGEEGRVVLAVKLPSGQRVQRAFRPADTLGAVMKFAENSARLDFGGCEFVADDPRQPLKDLSRTIVAAGLQTKTLLHVQAPDD